MHYILSVYEAEQCQGIVSSGAVTNDTAKQF